MLKVQYLKHPDIAHHLYDRLLAFDGVFPWNDEVPHYFAIFIYARFFLKHEAILHRCSIQILWGWKR